MLKGLLVWYLLVNTWVVVALVWDKAAARSGSRRVPERTLHLLALAGGWPASAVTQRLVRHKTRKTAFQLQFWLCAAVHCGIVVVLYHSLIHNL